MRITRVVFDSDMRQGFKGLRQLCREQKLAHTHENSRIVFINRAQTAFKLLAGDAYLVYYKTEGSRKIPLTALQYLPQYFGGSQLEMDNAIRKHLMRKMKFKEDLDLEIAA